MPNYDDKPSEYGGKGGTYAGRSHSDASTELRRVYQSDDNGFDTKPPFYDHLSDQEYQDLIASQQTEEGAEQ